MVLNEEEIEMLKNMTVKERIAYGTAIGKNLKISKAIGDAFKSGIKRIKKWIGKD